MADGLTAKGWDAMMRGKPLSTVTAYRSDVAGLAIDELPDSARQCSPPFDHVFLVWEYPETDLIEVTMGLLDQYPEFIDAFPWRLEKAAVNHRTDVVTYRRVEALA